MKQATKFSDMVYSRPDDAAMEKRYAEMALEAAQAQSAQELWALLDEDEQISSTYHTMNAMANIRHSVNTTDEFYAGEIAFFDERDPLFSNARKQFQAAVLNAPMREALEKETGSLVMEKYSLELRTMSEEIIPLCQRDNEVCTAYEKLLASAEIPFEGKTFNLSQIQAFQTSTCRETRRKAWEATAGFFLSNADELDSMFDELVRNRTEQAKALGHENYLPLGYDRMRRLGYGPDEVRAFREQVVKYVVPVTTRIKARQAARLGIDRTMYYDNAIAFPDGNPKPIGGEAEIVSAAQKMYHEMGEKTGEFIDYMIDGELFDLQSRAGKQTGGYCTSLQEYGSPFIFANFNGTAGDVAVLTHEGGHALSFYLSRDMRLAEYRDSGMETCETHSMSMELFASRWAESFFGKDTGKFLRYQLEDILGFLPYGCMVDEFQETMYLNPSLTPAQRKDVWASLERKYRPWIHFDGVPFFEGGGYQRQHHIYSAPLYYIEYCLAQTAALEFWAASLEDWDDAFARYLRFSAAAGTKTFSGLLEEAGLASPFKEGAVATICAAAEQWLDRLEAESL